jgi:hypothetical protein
MTTQTTQTTQMMQMTMTTQTTQMTMQETIPIPMTRQKTTTSHRRAIGEIDEMLQMLAEKDKVRD